MYILDHKLYLFFWVLKMYVMSLSFIGYQPKATSMPYHAPPPPELLRVGLFFFVYVSNNIIVGPIQ